MICKMLWCIYYLHTHTCVCIKQRTYDCIFIRIQSLYHCFGFPLPCLCCSRLTVNASSVASWSSPYSHSSRPIWTSSYLGRCSRNTRWVARLNWLGRWEISESKMTPPHNRGFLTTNGRDYSPNNDNNSGVKVDAGSHCWGVTLVSS